MEATMVQEGMVQTIQECLPLLIWRHILIKVILLEIVPDQILLLMDLTLLVLIVPMAKYSMYLYL